LRDGSRGEGAMVNTTRVTPGYPARRPIATHRPSERGPAAAPADDLDLSPDLQRALEAVRRAGEGRLDRLAPMAPHVPLTAAPLTLAPVALAPPRRMPDPDPFEEELKLPAGWYAPEEPEPRRFVASFATELKAAAIGLLAGLVMLVPAVLWLGGTGEGPLPSSRRETGQVRTIAKGEVQPPPLAAGLVPAEIAPIRPEPQAIAESDRSVEEAARHIARGDVLAARTALATAAAAQNARALFAMAETFDPTRLAAWGTRGVEADALRARALYAAAASLGHETAKARFDALE
jgi:hypothetical protein